MRFPNDDDEFFMSPSAARLMLFCFGCVLAPFGLAWLSLFCWVLIFFVPEDD